MTLITPISVTISNHNTNTSRANPCIIIDDRFYLSYTSILYQTPIWGQWKPNIKLPLGY